MFSKRTKTLAATTRADEEDSGSKEAGMKDKKPKFCREGRGGRRAL